MTTDAEQSKGSLSVNGAHLIQEENLFTADLDSPDMDDMATEANKQKELAEEQLDDDDTCCNMAEEADCEFAASQESAFSDVVMEESPKKKHRQAKLCDQQVKSHGKACKVQGIPSTHVLVQKALFAQCKKDHAIVTEMKQNMGCKTFSSDWFHFPLAWQFLSTALSAGPTLSHPAASVVISPATMWFPTQVSPTLVANVTGDKVMNVCPSQHTPQKVMMDLATDALIDVAAEPKEAEHVTLLADKDDKKDGVIIWPRLLLGSQQDNEKRTHLCLTLMVLVRHQQTQQSLSRPLLANLAAC